MKLSPVFTYIHIILRFILARIDIQVLFILCPLNKTIKKLKSGLSGPDFNYYVLKYIRLQCGANLE